MRIDEEPDNAGVVCNRRAVVRTGVMMMVMVMTRTGPGNDAVSE